MKKVFAIVISAFFVGASFVYADEAETAGITTEEASEITQGLFDKTWSVTPRVGILGFQDATGSHASRMMEGFTTQYSLANLVGRPLGLEMGLESGLLYSHIGSPGSNFFGTQPPIRTAQGANSYLIPLNATIGYRVSNQWLVAMNLGASIFHRSIGNSMILGRAGDGVAGTSTDVFPDLGVNVGWALSKTIGVSLRGEWIPTPQKPMYSATLGATIGLT